MGAKKRNLIPNITEIWPVRIHCAIIAACANGGCFREADPLAFRHFLTGSKSHRRGIKVWTKFALLDMPCCRGGGGVDKGYAS